ncbi:putative baseplate assembly protein [Dankookia rubra]|uniref:Putative baseplate assembly protein n=1 Tax=Dankookia rubra TaxID=1442381 RepID=A0A4R5QFW9_9PROT|nr:putative baseplate assembly protein [Dankookia rubra]TDH62150.1 putative baseplate assembly protein [Dankookia rubra]
MTSRPRHNRPGLAALDYRPGGWASFREAMLARLADPAAPFRPLNALRTRTPDDPMVALLDAFACAGEVLGFYQERLANEGFLRTATEPRSLEELGKLTGYRSRPGVAASVFLAYTLDDRATVTISAGSRVQSVPGPGEIAQTFETDEDLPASGAWNALRPRLSSPVQASGGLARLTLDGTATGLKPNDPLLLVVAGAPVLRRVATVDVRFDRGRTLVALQPAAAPTPTVQDQTAQDPVVRDGDASVPAGMSGAAVTARAVALAARAQLPPASHPADPRALRRASEVLFAPQTESTLALVAGVSPAQRSAVFRALGRTAMADPPALQVFAFRARTAPFGNRAPPKVELDATGRLRPPREWDLTEPVFGDPVPVSVVIAPTRTVRSLAEARPGRGAFDVMRDATADGSDTVVVMVAAAGGTATLTLPVREGARDGAALAGAPGKVEAVLERFATSPAPGWDLVLTFSDLPLTLVLRQDGDGPPTIANRRETEAEVALAIVPGQAGLDLRGTVRPIVGRQATEAPDVLFLDGSFETVTPGSWVAFEAPPGDPTPPLPLRIAGSDTVARTAYGQTARTTRLALEGKWIDPPGTSFRRAIRETTVHASSEALKLLDDDLDTDIVQTAASPVLELDGLSPGLESGRWLIVAGERTDLPGVAAAEVVMLAGAEHVGAQAPDGTPLPGETPHTRLTFAAPLAYPYRRASLQVLGNVVRASHGESCDEVLGSGDGSRANQSFTLKKAPLTFVAADLPSGAASTLRVWVNGVEWHEVAALAAVGPDARVFATTAAGGGTTIRFGDGVHGARLPTGTENLRARYRAGLGRAGNVAAGTMTTLLSRPLGVTGVTNPVAASGGADREAPEAARRNIPVGTVSLERLVSLRDYEDFARSFVGIGKAAAARFAGRDGPLVHLTVAGAEDAEVDPGSALFQSLRAALAQQGDPLQEVELAPRAGRLVLLAAGVAVEPDRLWSDVEPVVRAALLDHFGFDRRMLGQTLHASEVVAAIQAVPGVAYVDLRLLAGIPQPSRLEDLHEALRHPGVGDLAARPARTDPDFAGRPRRILPAELVYLSGRLHDMLLLEAIAR